MTPSPCNLSALRNEKKKNLLTWERIISYLKILDERCCNTSTSKLLIKFFSYKRALNIKLRYTLKFMTSSFGIFFFTLRKPILTQLLFPHLFSTFLNTHHRLVSVKATHCLTPREKMLITEKFSDIRWGNHTNENFGIGKV